MKRIIFIITLIFVFCFAAFAQTENILCPKIVIKAPEYVDENYGTFKVSASFQNVSNSSSPKFDWIIIKNKEVLRKYSETTIELDTKIVDKEYWIEILAGNENAKCKELAWARVLIIPNVGDNFPLLTYEGNINWNFERADLDNLLLQFQKSKDQEIFAFFEFSKKTLVSERQNHLEKVLNHLLSRPNFKKEQITFFVSETDRDEDYFWYQLFEKDSSSKHYCQDCILIRGEDLEKLVNLFQPISRTKNLKQKNKKLL